MYLINYLKWNSKYFSIFVSFVFFIFLLSADLFAFEFDSVKRHQEMLYNHDFKDLENSISKIETKYISNKSLENEIELTSIYRVFNMNRIDAKAHFDQWIINSPNSHIPYIARGIYHYRRAWNARGSKYIDETTQEQINGLRYFMLESKKDFIKAIENNDNTFISYLHLMDAAKTGVFGQGKVDYYFKMGLKVAPNSYTLHLWYALNIRPRWGGTEEQWKYLDEITRDKLEKHPYLNVAKGVILSVYSTLEKRKGDTDKALDLLDKAVLITPAADFYYQKFLILHEKNKFKEAENSLISAHKIKPGKASYIKEMASLKYKFRKYSECINLSNKAIYRGENTSRAYKIRGLCYEYSGKFNKAKSDYQQALLLNSNDKNLQSWIKEMDLKEKNMNISNN